MRMMSAIPTRPSARFDCIKAQRQPPEAIIAVCGAVGQFHITEPERHARRRTHNPQAKLSRRGGVDLKSWKVPESLLPVRLCLQDMPSRSFMARMSFCTCLLYPGWISSLRPLISSRTRGIASVFAFISGIASVFAFTANRSGIALFI